MKCDVNDMAVILTGAVPFNVGKFVTVVRPHRILKDVGFVWWIRSTTPLMTINGMLMTEGYIPDKFLDPIRGNQPQQQTKTATPKTEVVKT